MDTIKTVPEPTLRRLPLYHRILVQMRESGRNVVSCTRISQELGLYPTQVRKDLAATGIVGKPKVGYEVEALMGAIEEFLGWRNLTDAFVVGAGNLGTALLGYEGFKEHGLNIVAAFDADPGKVGTTVHGKEVFPLEKMGDLVNRLHLQIAVLTVPAAAAQDVADLVVLLGVRAVWNFTQTRLNVPAGVIVENQDLSASLAVLSRKLAELVRRLEEPAVRAVS